jgi:hypothetical protein
VEKIEIKRQLGYIANILKLPDEKFGIPAIVDVYERKFNQIFQKKNLERPKNLSRPTLFIFLLHFFNSI